LKHLQTEEKNHWFYFYISVSDEFKLNGYYTSSIKGNPLLKPRSKIANPTKIIVSNDGKIDIKY